MILSISPYAYLHMDMFFGKMTMQMFCPFINQVVFFIIELQSYVCMCIYIHTHVCIYIYSGCKFFIRYVIYISFLPFYSLLFHSLDCFLFVCFAKRMLNLMKVEFFSFFLWICLLLLYLRKRW